MGRHWVKLKGLVELHLVGNRLTGPVPESVNQLRGLRMLLLRGNQLTYLPSSIGQLQSLN